MPFLLFMRVSDPDRETVELRSAYLTVVIGETLRGHRRMSVRRFL